MDFKDYYQILGVAREASADDIRKAYRKLARKYHPDVSKEADAGARMAEINEAHDVLRDDEKRTAYDALADRVARGGQPGSGGFEAPPGWVGSWVRDHMILAILAPSGNGLPLPGAPVR